MMKSLVQEMPFGQLAKLSTRPQMSSESPADGAFSLLWRWIERRRQRKALGELAAFNKHMLHDIGVSIEDARHEADKPFWR